ncbi:PIF-4 [Rachiplusia nu nucleopolyhedrovirus]|uniref:PIF-4 n=1 Tax=Rachiplusia nu nucleopolyhedrovirus TaxID=2605775 RepID=A0AAF1DB36_9ABAC|nr:PIF-4 [Rachiplusia nu nucleopolyhedrovirus]QEI03616.1 PIF-4 [Rachiplusia nu nucleopolyhedrovirus]
MLLNISLISFVIVAAICLLFFMAGLFYLNPYRASIYRLVLDHAHTLQYGAYIDIYDLSTSKRTERLFVIKPENVLIYNVDGTLYYYLESSSVFCPQEFSLVRFSRADIQAINNSGLYSTVCSNVNSLVVLEHFLTLKNNIPDDRIVLSVDEINYTILDVINLLIYTGFVHVL